MYNTSKEYIDAFLQTGLKVGDTVKIARRPVPEDGVATVFDCSGDRLWCYWYQRLPTDFIGTIRCISSTGLISTYPDCGYNIPFFLLEGYDHLLTNLKLFSKSNYLDFDVRVNKIRTEYF